jgi:phosphoglycolate phosphatase
MAQLLLRGEPLGWPEGPAIPFQAVLFDKDGTLSHSEPMLLRLARSRIDQCLALLDARSGSPSIDAMISAASTEISPDHGEAGNSPGFPWPGDDTDSLGSTGRGALVDLLRRAYGIEGHGLHPGGITAVAARDHNLIATATALSQVGVIWPDALAIAEAAFEATDGLAAGEGLPEPTPGLAALLNRLSQAGLVCAVISNDHRQGIRSFLERHELTDRFAAIWSADDHPRKPSAGAVRGLCELLGIPPGRCALIGDAASDLRMARAAGVPVALGYRSGWQLPPGLDPGTVCLEHWDELEAVAL